MGGASFNTFLPITRAKQTAIGVRYLTLCIVRSGSDSLRTAKESYWWAVMHRIRSSMDYLGHDAPKLGI